MKEREQSGFLHLKTSSSWMLPEIWRILEFGYDKVKGEGVKGMTKDKSRLYKSWLDQLLEWLGRT